MSAKNNMPEISEVDMRRLTEFFRKRFVDGNPDADKKGNLLHGFGNYTFREIYQAME